MALFKAYEPTAQVNGETILSFVNGLGAFKDTALQLLKDQGIDDPQPGQWYSHQGWLSAFEELRKKYGVNCIIMVGKAIPKHANLPPEIDSVEKAMASINVAYRMNHRGNVGSFTFEIVGPQQGKMICDNPYHCAFDQAVLKAMAEKFKKPGQQIKLTHDEGGCRLNGDDSCTYTISW